MFDYDRSNFISFLNSFPEQIQHSQQLMANLSINIDVAGIQNIVLSGMGGSGISGDLLLAYTADEITVPTFINRDYHIPGFVNEHTLFVAVSYSGDTEETLSAMEQAADRSARMVGISFQFSDLTFFFINVSGQPTGAFAIEAGGRHNGIMLLLPFRPGGGFVFHPVIPLVGWWKFGEISRLSQPVDGFTLFLVQIRNDADLLGNAFDD